MSLLVRRVSAVVSMLRAARGRAYARALGGGGAPSDGRRASLAAYAVAAASACFLLAVGAMPAWADSCPNAQFRTGPSAHLPDCRAYEQVSPVDKNGSDIVDLFGNKVAPSGDRIAYATVNPTPDAQGIGLVAHLRSIRGSGGWSTRDLSPPLPVAEPIEESTASAFSADLSGAVWYTHEEPPRLPGTDANALNFYRQLDAPGGSYELMDVGSAVSFPTIVGAAWDLSHVLLTTFATGTSLTADTPPLSASESELYDWTGGRWHLVGVLPDGTATPDGTSPFRAPGQMSTDGSRIFFVGISGNDASLYVRINDDRTLLLADLGSAGEASFLGATPSGSRAFYLAPGGEFFVADVDSGQSTDIGPGPGSLLGTSDDGSYAYFLTFAGDLEVWHNGMLTPIASNSQVNLGTEGEGADVSPNGRYLVFTTTQPLTAFDNAGFAEVYRYDAHAATLTCVSCDAPGGPRPVGSANLTSTNFSFDPNVPASNLYHVKSVLDDGRVFFETPDALVPSDTNGNDGCPVSGDVFDGHEATIRRCQDVYEWDGQPHLISTGQSDAPSTFSDASPSGDDVFFITRQPLVGSDTDSNADLYDARVGGGFPGPPSSPPPCSGEDCKGSPAASPAPPKAASVQFFGPGNATPGVALAKPKVLTRTVHGAAFLVKVSVPGEGRLTIGGSGIRTVKRSVSQAATYRLRVRLTARHRRALIHKRKLRLRLRVGYLSVSGESSSVTVALTVKR